MRKPQRSFLLLLFLLIAQFSFSQQTTFPSTWIGDWKGELLWYKTGKAEPQKVTMELRIHPTDTAGTYSWLMIYGKPSDDSRPYQLIALDSLGIHWMIDELNGIRIDQFWVGNRFSGSFTVLTNTITNSYWMEDGKIMAEFYSVSAKPITTTGNGTDESPTVNSYKIGSYQKAILHRVKSDH